MAYAGLLSIRYTQPYGSAKPTPGEAHGMSRLPSDGASGQCVQKLATAASSSDDCDCNLCCLQSPPIETN